MYKRRWKIAIKTTRVANEQSTRDPSSEAFSKPNQVDDEEMSLLMDEAKTMWKVGSYHENIVNLQGICVDVEEASIRRVRTSN